mmetsp:Transcript_48491/g.115410  ORF Transcript_48491/g.115410 Transcript_48491/m.115410 type:complete len:225 (-) Transcript_48491:539-1213(-)
MPLAHSRVSERRDDREVRLEVVQHLLELDRHALRLLLALKRLLSLPRELPPRGDIRLDRVGVEAGEWPVGPRWELLGELRRDRPEVRVGLEVDRHGLDFVEGRGRKLEELFAVVDHLARLPCLDQPLVQDHNLSSVLLGLVEVLVCHERCDIRLDALELLLEVLRELLELLHELEAVVLLAWNRRHTHRVDLPRLAVGLPVKRKVLLGDVELELLQHVVLFTRL